ncbi:sensor histidine kinase [Alteromonas ponticola]|uniref:Histidine kinase n=1 Tax=Alteromonas ponticola TaxID=2720613 RepID=A0ABX1R2X7_9ALTE|nr:histidine kinase [Alteromonas ponticola]NMH59986.1 histidine kinase [Alteromonas ponticola]
MSDSMNVHLSRYFWVVTVFVWLSIHLIISLIQHNALTYTSNPVNFAAVWWKLAPWFGNWIWMTAIIFLIVRNNDSPSFYKRLACHLIGLIVLLPLYWFTCVTMRTLANDKPLSSIAETLLRVISNSALLDACIYFAVLGLAFGIRFYQNAMTKQVELNHVNELLIKEQLKTLRSQLNPHFIFNTLNTIVSLVRLKRDAEAVLALTELSQMLRKILENKNTSEASIKDEMIFINSYLAIQKMRFSDKLNTTVEVEENCLDIVIPNMLLHPLVENAIQHGSQLQRTVNNFHMAITRDNGMLEVRMTNNVGDKDEAKGFGIGLGNTREILERLYTHFQLEIKQKYKGTVETVLSIPIGGSNV